MRLHRRTLAGTVAGFAIAALLVSRVDLEALLSTLLSADYRFLVASLFFFMSGLFTRALRWQGLLRGQLPLQRAFNIMNIAYLVNGVIPLRIGEVARLFLTTRANKQIPFMQTGSSILVERLLDVLGVALLAMIATAAAPVSAELRQLAMLGAIFSLSGFAALLILARWRGFTDKVIRGISNVLPLIEGLKPEQLAREFLDGLQPLLEFAPLARALIWTAISWLLSVITNYVLMLAFFDQGDWVAIMFSIASASFAIAIPLVPGNLGAYEFSIVVAFTLLGHRELDKITAFALAVHAQNILVYIATGGIGLIFEGISLTQLRTHAGQLHQNDSS
ncbi:MAG: lysylphosphatidylglycerol synthase transmembrane domain-containing protein [Chloroflexota bacterium]|nr:lysylphosphatidylglycerol synthase transmembrane domain-containing protein [Chloroflexota bacterium]